MSQDAPDTAIPATTKVLMIASGKGGVGKSTVTTNLAAALAHKGHAVGVMDADIWGFSVPRMLGVSGDLVAFDGKIEPLTRQIGEGRLEVVSMGFMVGKEDSALMWPPGTGDVQMGLAKMLPRAEMVVITTPALNAQKVGARVVDMGRKNYLRIVGVIENMTEFIVPNGSAHRLFGAGGGQQLAADVGAPLLGRVPIESVISGGGDIGEPAGCSARMLDAAIAALDALDAESIA